MDAVMAGPTRSSRSQLPLVTVVDAVPPDAAVVAEELQAAMGLDTLASTRAIRTKVETPDEINEVFDPIAYEKTAGVLGMIEAYVGPELFSRGVSSYLNKYALGNAAGEDFWTEMTRVTEKPINRVMKSFVEQPGAPLLTVKTRCVAGSTEVSIAQSRFVGGARRRRCRATTLDAAGREYRQRGARMQPRHRGGANGQGSRRCGPRWSTRRARLYFTE